MASIKQGRADLIDRAKKQRDSIQELFDDAAHWNDTHTPFEYIDPDPDGQLSRILVDLNRCITAEFGLPLKLVRGIGGEGSE